jgi:hypothetical protein
MDLGAIHIKRVVELISIFGNQLDNPNNDNKVFAFNNNNNLIGIYNTQKDSISVLKFLDQDPYFLIYVKDYRHYAKAFTQKELIDLDKNNPDNA